MTSKTSNRLHAPTDGCLVLFAALALIVGVTVPATLRWGALYGMVAGLGTAFAVLVLLGLVLGRIQGSRDAEAQDPPPVGVPRPGADDAVYVIDYAHRDACPVRSPGPHDAHRWYWVASLADSNGRHQPVEGSTWCRGRRR